MALHAVDSPDPQQRRVVQPRHPAPLPIRPLNLLHLGAWMVVWALAAGLLYRDSTSSFVAWYATVVWTMPLGIAALGIAGSFTGRRLINEELESPDPGMIKTPVIVTIVTKGDDSVYGALKRAAESMPLFRKRFSNFTGYIVTDHGAEAMDDIVRLCNQLRLTLIVTPPKEEWMPANGTRFKARAAHYAHTQIVDALKRRYHGVIPQDAWVIQYDDDTAVMPDSVLSWARAIKANCGPDDKLLLQGNLVYPRRFSTSWFNWLADSIRPGDDLGRFALTTGRGTPLNGCHGENLGVRVHVIDELGGWDFGPDEIVEDSRLALTFAQRYPGRSGWITARCYGASPVSAADFVKQRIRWAEGMARLVFSRKKRHGISLRKRLLVLHNIVVWAFGALQPVLAVFLVSWLVKDYHVTPVIPWLGAVWVYSMAYTCWIYLSGLKANSLASGWKRMRIRDVLGVLLFLPLFSVMEGLGGTIGVLKVPGKYMATFPLISKPS